MNDETTANDNRNARLIVDIAFHQTQMLESISDDIDYKAGVLIGFLAVAITLVLQVGVPSSSSILDMLFSFTGFGFLFGAFSVLISSLAPRTWRYGPDVQVLVNKCRDFEEATTLKMVAEELKEVWAHNGPIHERKARLFKIGLWLSLTGIGLLVLDVLIIRPFA